MADLIGFTHIFVDHSNMWGGARCASKIHYPKVDDERARISARGLDRVLRGTRRGTSTKVVSGGVPPGLEGMWSEYQKAGYDTQRLFRDKHWKEHGVDHTLIGHMWRLMAIHQSAPTTLVIASGDGRRNEFGTSFIEVVREILTHKRYDTWTVELASFDWVAAKHGGISSPTNPRMREIVEKSPRGEFINLFDSYAAVVYHQR